MQADELEMVQDKIEEAALENNEYLFFNIQSVCMGVPISDIREIVKKDVVQPVPHTKKTMLGIINLRGRLISLIDLASMLNLKTNASTNPRLIMIIEQEDQSIGVLFDSLKMVETIDPAIISDAQNLNFEAPNEFVKGVVNLNNELIPLINLRQWISETAFFAGINQRRAG